MARRRAAGCASTSSGASTSGPGTDGVQGTPDDVYTTNYKRDSTSVVAIDPDGDGVPDVVIVGTRKALDYMVCCGDAGQVHDIQAATAGGTLDAYDTETVAAAIIRPPLDPGRGHRLPARAPSSTAFWTINREDDVGHGRRLHDHRVVGSATARPSTRWCRAASDGILGNADDTSIPITAGQFNERDATMDETGTTKLFTDELRQNRLPGLKRASATRRTR